MKTSMHRLSASILAGASLIVQPAQAETTSGLARKLATCAGRLAAAHSYIGIVDDLQKTISANARALDYLIRSVDQDRPSLDRLAEEEKTKFAPELIVDPMETRNLVTRTKSECDSHVTQALRMFDEEKALFQKKAQQEADLRLKAKIRAEAKIAREKAAYQQADSTANY